MGANSEYFIQLQEQFLNDCDRYDNGHISALDVAVKFKEEMSFLEHLTNQRKTWIDENLESVSNEADNYNNEYKGYKVTLQTREDRKSTRLNSSHLKLSRMPSSA